MKSQATGDDSAAQALHSPAAAGSPQALTRLHWIDYAKGIAIGLVVLGHVDLGLITAGLASQTTRPWLTAIDDFIYRFHMPVFFFVGGLFAERLRTRPAVTSLMSLGRTIVYPYFVWSMIQGLLLLAFASYANHPASIHDLALTVVEPPMQFWFLYVYFLIALIYLLVAKGDVSKFGIAAMFFVLWLLAACGLGVRWKPLMLAQNYGVFFVAGDIARPYLLPALNPASSARRRWIPVAIVSFVLVGVLSHLVELPFGPLSGLAGILGTCCLAAYLAANQVSRFVELCGIFSLEIYVLHTLFSAAARIGLTRVCGITNLSIHIGAGLLAGLVVPLLIALVASKSRLGWLFRFPDSRHPPRTVDAETSSTT